MNADGDEQLKSLIEALNYCQKNITVRSSFTALQSIYGADAITLHADSEIDHSSSLRYNVLLTLEPTYEDVSFRICVSIPPRYPEECPPQLQLLSRYIGSFGVDTDLFGIVTRAFISTAGVPWSPGDVSVFDGLESVKNIIYGWYETRLSEAKVVQLAREDQVGERSHSQSGEVPGNLVTGSGPLAPHAVSQLPPGVEIVESPPIQDRGSVFVARVCRIDRPSQVPLIVENIRSDRRIARAAHPTIHAWRCTDNGVLHQDNDDDGETAAGGRLAHLLQILEVDHVLVVVTRHFGGVLLGADRFKHINQCARDALELGGFVADEKQPRRSRKPAKKRA
ncbi:ribosomal protein S5 domain 2-type protein [Cantharellus anzutake]|uniref:ribosomal protein S5 domain 2-type protein n=1 Tax=Cantharellus anzutake TaxID=1750568 RepID=UPI0019063899|nr:ribosomal protein S5 domain 2-type protein [Cantharellus anzutake]KAF8339204.1 ribosomal protein S5 domain 2-type protein [Cantharellus anzutake]